MVNQEEKHIFEVTQTDFGKKLAYKLWNSIDNT